MSYKTMQQLEKKKERLENINDSFDFAKHDPASLKQTNNDIRKLEKSYTVEQLKDLSRGVIRFGLIAAIIGTFALITYRQETKPPAPELHQVRQVYPALQAKDTPTPVIEDKAEAQLQRKLATGAYEPEFMKQLKQSDNYKKNEALAKKLATADCSYKTTKQGDFYVCEFKGEK